MSWLLLVSMTRYGWKIRIIRGRLNSTLLVTNHLRLQLGSMWIHVPYVTSLTFGPLYYGGCRSRLIHYIIFLWVRHPSVSILGGKWDFKAAYHWVSLHGDIAEKCAQFTKTLLFWACGLSLVALNVQMNVTSSPSYVPISQMTFCKQWWLYMCELKEEQI